MVSSNDARRLFLQGIISRRVISQKDAVLLWRKCVDAVKAADETLEIPWSGDRNSWDNWVSEINTELTPLSLEFTHFLDQSSGKETYALVNRKGDEIAQIATGYTAAEITFFKALVEQIMLAPHRSYCMSSMAALREVKALKLKMSPSQTELLLGSFVAKGWLERSERGRYSLSQRALTELQQYIRNAYPDQILDCTICFEMVTHGFGCGTPNCKGVLHQNCYDNYRRRNSKCPTCGGNWGPTGKSSTNKSVMPIGEAAYRDGQDKLKRRVRRSEDDDDDDEEAEDGEEVGYEEEPPSQQQPSEPQPSRTQKKRLSKRRAVQDDGMEVDGGDQEDEDEVQPTQTQPRRRSSRR